MRPEKITAAILALTLAAGIPFFASCDKSDNTSETGTDTQSVSASNLNTQETEQSLTLVSNGKSEFSIVCPDLWEPTYSQALKNIQTAVLEKTGVKLTLTTDLQTGLSYGETVNNNNYEILVGPTNRAESVHVSDSIGEGTFYLSISGNKILLCGSDEFYVYCAVNYFIENIIGGASDGSEIVIEKDFVYTDSSVEKNVGNLIASGLQISDELTVEKIMDIPADGSYKYMQGGASDGKYLYFLLNDGDSTDASMSKIIKVDPETMQTVASNSGLAVRHANDMTYDSVNKRLVVSWCNVDSTKVSFINPETLAITAIKTTAQGHYAIAYCEETDKYVVGNSGGYDFSVLNSNFRYPEKYTGVETGYVKQGMECDANYIYFIQSPTKTTEQNNIVIVYDWNGNHVRTFSVALASESENIISFGDYFYSAFNTSDGMQLYKLSLNY